MGILLLRSRGKGLVDLRFRTWDLGFRGTVSTTGIPEFDLPGCIIITVGIIAAAGKVP